ncbi:MAG TPA: vitamin K epoxide reductase family protein [Longimicrobiaceae bacterium]|nr:vitamin K epoxide reductase family protein [Longimicrobiaceae bacterium]
MRKLAEKFDDWSSEPGGRELSAELRHGTGEFLGNRRKIAACVMVAIGSMSAISLYQLGILKHLPEPPIPRLDADRVDGSADAYAKLHTPDAVLGLHSYSTTLALAAMGGDDRSRSHPWIPLALTGKLLFDAVQAGKLTVDQWTKHRAFCSWCLLAATATFAAVPLMIPEARAALENIRD